MPDPIGNRPPPGARPPSAAGSDAPPDDTTASDVALADVAVPDVTVPDHAVPSAPAVADRVSDVVDRHIRGRPTPTQPTAPLHTRLDTPGRTALDVRLDASRATATLAGAGAGSSFPTVSASLDSSGVAADARGNVTVRDDARGRVDLDGRLGVRRSSSGASAADLHLGVNRTASGAADDVDLDLHAASGAGLSADATLASTRDIAGGTATVRGRAHVDGSGGNVRGSLATDVTRGDTRHLADHGGSASLSGGRWSADGYTSGSATTTSPDGATRAREHRVAVAATPDGAIVDASGALRRSGPDGGTRELSGSARGNWSPGAAPHGSASGRYATASGSGDDRVSHAVDARLDGAPDRAHADVSYNRDGARLDVDSRLSVDADGGGVRGSGSARASGVALDDDDYRVTWDAGVDGGIDAGGVRFDASAGVDGRGRTAVYDETLAFDGSLDVAVSGGAATASGKANATWGDADDPVSARGEVHGSVRASTASPADASASGGGSATVRTNSPSGLVTETAGAAESAGRAPTLSLRHERTWRGTSSSTAVSLNADVAERAGSVAVRRATDYNATDARLDVRTAATELRVEHERNDARMRRSGGHLRLDDTGAAIGGNTLHSDVLGGNLDSAGSVGVSRTRELTLGARTSTGGGRLGALHLAADGQFGERTLDGLVSATREWRTAAGVSISAAFAAHVRRASTVENKGAVTDIPGLEDKHRVVMAGVSQAEAALGGGATAGAFGAGAFARAGRASVVTYVTHVDEATARELERAGTRDIPDIAKPEALRAHDVLRVITSGDVGMSADLTVFGVGVAGHATLRGEFAMTVHKLDDERVRVTVEPKQVWAAGVDVTALVAVAGIEGERARSLAQSYELDLSTTAGVKAYHDALGGRLPEAPIRAAFARTDDALDLVERMNRELPEGVRALSFALGSTVRHAERVGLSWTLFAASLERSTTREERATAHAGRVLHERAATNERTHRTWLSGTERAGVYAVVAEESARAADGAVTTTFKDVRFGARFSDDWLSGRELNGILRKLRDVFGLSVPDVDSDADGERRDIELSLAMDARLLSSLTPPQLLRLVPAAAKAGADQDAAKLLVRKLTMTTSAADRAHALQEFVAEEGLCALGAVVRAFPDVRLDVAGETTGYDKARDKAALVLDTLDRPLDPGNVLEFAGRYRLVKGGLDVVRRAAKRALEDPFLAIPERAPLAHELDGLAAKLEKLIDLEPLSRADVVRLRGGLGMLAGMTVVDYALLDYVDAALARKGG